MVQGMSQRKLLQVLPTMVNVTDALSPNFDLNFDFGPEMETIISSFVMATGFLFLFWGTRLFKATMFLFSFLAAGFLAYFFTMNLTCCDNVTGGGNSKTSIIVAGVVALFVSCLVMKTFKLAIFAIGAGVGVVVWLVWKELFPGMLQEEVNAVVCCANKVMMIDFL